MDALRGGRRRPLAPQLIDEALGAEHRAASQDEERESRPLPAPAELEQLVAIPDFEGAQNPEVRGSSLLAAPDGVPPPQLHK